MVQKATSILLALLFSATLLAQQPKRPDLIVVVSIDQFPYSYLTRFQPYFGDGGFNRFLHDGASFTHAKYPYSTTYTGPGHAAIGTGYVPAKSGIIGNTWFDRNERGPQYCVGDDHARGGFSPQNLASDSLGDLVQDRYAGSRVFGVALKDRAAILMAGRKATSAYWFDSSIPGFTSSSYYHSNKQLADDFNRIVPDLIKSHPMWEQSDFIPAADLDRITHDPERLRKYKTSREGLGVSFPHRIATAEALTYTPFGNELVIGFAEKLIETENLGTEDGKPDLVFVGLSSPDYLGHNYGPDSLEAADTVVRTDRQLAAFFHDLDAKFGARYTVAISSDHGVQSIPEVARDMGRDAGRVDMRNPNATIRTYGELAPRAGDEDRGEARHQGHAVHADREDVHHVFRRAGDLSQLDAHP